MAKTSLPLEFSKTSVTMRLSTRFVERFRSEYPSMMSRYVDNALRLALSDRNMFEKIIWYEFSK